MTQPKDPDNLRVGGASNASPDPLEKVLLGVMLYFGSEIGITEDAYYEDKYEVSTGELKSSDLVDVVNEAKAQIQALLHQQEAVAELYGRLHETIEAFQAGAIDAKAYSKRHAVLTDRIATLKQKGGV